MERRAEQSLPAGREEAWFQVARRAAFFATAEEGEKRDFEAVRKILKNACERLPASSLAAAAVAGGDPVLSAAFAHAIQRVDLRGRGGDVSGAAEAASECRDALARFGASGNDELISIWKKAGRAGFAPGGASASVYHMLLVGEDFADSAGTDRVFAEGFRAGVRAAAGAQSGRFEIEAKGGIGDPHWRESYYAGAASRGGVVVVGSGDAEAAVATGVAASRGIVVVDARDPERVSPERADVANTNEYDPRREGEVLENPSTPGLDDSLRYESRGASPRGPDARFRRLRPVYVASPVGTERARRLVAWLRTQSGIDTIGVALPETGGDVALARAFAGLLVSTDDDVRRVAVPLRYAAGRRSYAPEVQRARAAGCDALVLCGPPEETAEWLRALRAARVRMLVLGNSGLDPAGLRDDERAAAEGAVYVDSNWRIVGSPRSAKGEAARAAGFDENDRDFERGYVTGGMIARRIVAGNCSAGLLRDAFEDESPVILGLARTMLNPGPNPALPGSGTIDLPLYRIGAGRAEPIPAR
jgi:hypothetical protein